MCKKRRLMLSMLTLAVVASILASCASSPSPSTLPPSTGCHAKQSNACPERLLVFSKTGAFRHASIKDGKIALRKLATEHHFAIDFSEDSTVFNAANLARYNAVVFLLTTGNNILDADQKSAFERYIRAGGGYVGIHSASDTEYNWSWYGGLVGAYNNSAHKHSSITRATIHVEDRTSPSTSMLPALWVRTDEWYNFATNPRGRVHVLMTMDEKTYQGGTMGADHPIAWYHEYDGGRAWYTALGHTSESYYEPLFLAHLWGGITYAVGQGSRSTTGSSAYQTGRIWQTIPLVNVANRAYASWLL